MSEALDANGYGGKYTFQELGTSELGGKLMAEGTNIEADMLTLSSYYLESAQAKDKVFVTLDVGKKPLQDFPDYMAPILGLHGTMFVNTELAAQEKLPAPKSVKDLTNPIYKDKLAVADIASSSSAWLFTQALIDNYGEKEAQDILTGIYKNAGDQILESGSGPIKAVRAGEAVVGFGLRQTAVADKEQGLPIDFIDPSEGNYQLVEALAVVDKGDDTNPLAVEMAKCIIENARVSLQNDYPAAMYEGETTDAKHQPVNPKIFPLPLTLELLEQHQAISEAAKAAAK
jgi:ABC-type Fe3+ transport system substrate-binding protein